MRPRQDSAGRASRRRGIEGRTSELVVFCPMRQQAPLHHLRHALAIHRADGDQHRRRGRLIPIGLEVRRRRVGRELQLDFDFGVIGGETNAAAHILSIAIHRALIEGHAQGRYRQVSMAASRPHSRLLQRRSRWANMRHEGPRVQTGCRLTRPRSFILAIPRPPMCWLKRHGTIGTHIPPP